MASRSRLGRAASRWELPAVIVLGVFSFFLRCLHLFDKSHYYVLSPDSHFFHWASRQLMAGEPLPSSPGAEDTYTLHSGLVYPLAYIAKFVSSVFNISPAESLDLAGKLLPPTLGLISLVVIYLATRKMYGHRVGLFCALS